MSKHPKLWKGWGNDKHRSMMQYGKRSVVFAYEIMGPLMKLETLTYFYYQMPNDYVFEFLSIEVLIKN